MSLSSDFQNTRGTVLVTFTQTGTYSTTVNLGGGWLMGMYSDNWPAATGSFVLRSSWSESGTGYQVMTVDGTVLKALAFGSGTFFTLGHSPWITAPLNYVTLQTGTAGTAGVAAGGTVVLITGI